MTTTIQTDLNFEQDGKQIGYLNIPHSRNESAWGVESIPCGVLKNGHGPTVICVGGVHGDEYEGPLALHALLHKWQAQDVQGKIIVLPAFNKAGLQQATRLSPLDGRDLNRAYPGVYDGSVGQRLVHFMCEYLIPQADMVIDVHSGGRSLEFLPCAVMHDSSDRAEYQTRCELLKAFGAPYSLILEELDSAGMLDSYVEGLGKTFLTTELGGAGLVTPQRLQIARNGLERVLQYYEVLNLTAEHNQPPAAQPSQWCELKQGGYIMAPCDGWFEPFYDIGDEVQEGQALGRLHDFRQPQQGLKTLTAPADGVIFCKRSKVYTEQGDSLVLIASYC